MEWHGWNPPHHCRGNLEFVHADIHSIPYDAVIAGTDKDGGRLYAGRGHHAGDLIPAKVAPHWGHAYVPYGGQEHPIHNFQVLTSNHVAWKYARDGEIPHEAVVFGRTSDGEDLFMGRSMHDGALIPGKVQPSHGCCYIPYGGQEISCKECFRPYNLRLPSLQPSYNLKPRATLTFRITKEIAESRRLRTHWQFDRSPTPKNLLNRQIDRVKMLLNDFRSEVWVSYINSLDLQDGSALKVAKVLRSEKRSSRPLRGQRGLAYTAADKAEAFADTIEDQFQPNHGVYDEDHADMIEDFADEYCGSPEEVDNSLEPFIL